MDTECTDDDDDFLDSGAAPGNGCNRPICEIKAKYSLMGIELLYKKGD